MFLHILILIPIASLSQIYKTSHSSSSTNVTSAQSMFLLITLANQPPSQPQHYPKSANITPP